ncbi:ATPase associated with chromosome architecture/replication [Roseomonas mucosa]|uniref:O-acetyl-ADP-ribose deacetylase n=2 Tax=Roseomonas mucosa TaxID=207340 RepID=A0A379N670_9PROT|nr:O-acetyl-ADP-ribose deacetylase [Roseomonas mucosa]MDT8274502.1 O-acetyl-ADP-ribose deacetylase [Roseomonas mucosa]MDT8288171.1 O-acetyl-ADP-ribose deacetylase [Roseomonas mucosa]MDT8293536.1 O-acetyl-ADP-ribose deacetylase [Roseomonas mucosa]MDT8313495.1 O-acetyl-ADP-ribose deacetylase [Roseomonas mucosa]MDT8349036.1 O-acetyl-ADP-ribose deacetylase [Roseomonas mucosa]
MAMQAEQTDITTLAVDAIVNAANRALAGGGGVDGAIHRAAGPELVRASRALAPCPTGEARITPGFRLPARHVIHTVGPVWHGGGSGEAELLAACYRNSIALLRQAGGRSIAFPAISTGIYGYPPGPAARIAVATVRQALEDGDLEVIFACFDAATLDLYRRELGG